MPSRPCSATSSVRIGRRQQLLAPAAPGMGDHGHPARAVDQVDTATDVDRVPGHVRRTTVGQEPVERLLAVHDVTGGHQRVGDVRATDRRAGSDEGQHLLLRHRHARARPACPAPVAADRSARPGPAPSPRPAPGPRGRRRTPAGARSGAPGSRTAPARAPPRRRSAPPPPSPRAARRTCRGRSAPPPSSPAAAALATSSAGVSVPSETTEWVWRSILMPHTYHAGALSSAAAAGPARPATRPRPWPGPACRRRSTAAS